MRTIFEIADECTAYVLMLTHGGWKIDDPPIDMPPVALAAIAPIIAAMIAATIEREKIEQYERHVRDSIHGG